MDYFFWVVTPAECHTTLGGSIVQPQNICEFEDDKGKNFQCCNTQLEQLFPKLTCKGFISVWDNTLWNTMLFDHNVHKRFSYSRAWVISLQWCKMNIFYESFDNNENHSESLRWGQTYEPWFDESLCARQ